MNSKEFVVKLGAYYREPLLLDGKPNIRLITLEKWITASGITPDKLALMFDKIILNFIPTSINPCPLIPHIVDICEIQTTEKAKSELAQSVANRVIFAYLNIGYAEEGSRDRAYKYIGELGVEVLTSMYSKWYSFCKVAENTDIEYLRKTLKDSVIAHINRTEKGIQNKTPELEDLSKKDFLMLENNI